MPDTATFQLGPLLIRIEGKHPVTAWAVKTFEAAGENAQSGLTFKFSDSPLAGESAGTVRLRLPRFDLAVGPGLKVDLFQRAESSIWLDWRTWLGLGNSVELGQIQQFAGEVMPFLVECGLLNDGCSLAHAAAMAVGDEALLVAGGSRVGKTSMLLPAVLKGKGKFLADDQAIVDQSGVVHLNPMPVRLYDDNLQCSPELSKFDSLAGKLRRRVYRSPTVRWIRPQDVFGPEKLARSARLSEVILLIQGSSDQFDFRPASPEEAAGLCGTMIAEELHGFAEQIADGNAVLPTETAMCDAIRGIFESALAGRRCGVVTVPPRGDPDELVRFARRHSPLLDAALGLAARI